MADNPKTPTSPRLKKLTEKRKDLIQQQEEWARKENLARTNVDRLSGGIALLEEQIQEELVEITPKSDRPVGDPLHD